ncbi:MAG TPA: hypothetical protein GYA10_08055 [Alphaproteobacteria bacterium]|nr:hypothetical protein [Alphaproteobacteria bacterium]
MCEICRARAQQLDAIAAELRMLARRGRHPGFAARLLRAADEVEAVATQVLESCVVEIDVTWASEPDDADTGPGGSVRS